ncbi:hypothetical protein [Rhizobium sp. SGZ-381]|uniref:hypothetical protein n=1 Tax=Rhizobium sp. SGZ-381 TaxID=3342800 RepID=UPI00366D7C63
MIDERKRILVGNERAKLAANSVDRLATACVAAGFIAPLVSGINGGGGYAFTFGIVLSTLTWLSTAFVLHLGARHILGKLEP